MRKAQYRLPRVEGDPEDAELVVFYFQGSGGAPQANIDRWIGQFTRPDGSPIGDAARTTNRQANGLPLTIGRRFRHLHGGERPDAGGGPAEARFPDARRRG